jgi:hypothetical protein
VQSGNEFSAPPISVNDTKYRAENLTAGVTYKFRIQARNSVGNSVFADGFDILCATKPDAPSAPSTSVFEDKVIVSWL